MRVSGGAAKPSADIEDRTWILPDIDRVVRQRAAIGAELERQSVSDWVTQAVLIKLAIDAQMRLAPRRK